MLRSVADSLRTCNDRRAAELAPTMSRPMFASTLDTRRFFKQKQ